MPFFKKFLSKSEFFDQLSELQGFRRSLFSISSVMNNEQLIRVDKSSKFILYRSNTK